MSRALTAPHTVAETALAPEASQVPSMRPIYRWLIWLPIAVAGLAAFALWDFVWYALSTALLINLKIILVMSWGSWTMVSHVRNIYHEDSVFRSGMAWVRFGARSGHPDPRLGPKAYVVGMLERLQKLGLGQQVYIHTSAMEPELSSLEDYLTKKQELSQFLIGLMVGLGLLGTFMGLLQTLVQTAGLIGDIAASSGSANGNIEQEFSKMVAGLKGPLAGMGTAFSASMFGLVGSIILGFQMIIVRKAALEFVERTRRDVLSVADRAHDGPQVEVTERFLASLLADILQQHKETGAGLRQTVAQLNELVPAVRKVAEVSNILGDRVDAQERALERANETLRAVSMMGPSIELLAQTTSRVADGTAQTNDRLSQVMEVLPRQSGILLETQVGVRETVKHLSMVTPSLQKLAEATASLNNKVGAQEETLDRVAKNLGRFERLAPTMDTLAESTGHVLSLAEQSNVQLAELLSFLPEQSRVLNETQAGLRVAVGTLNEVVPAIDKVAEASRELGDRVRSHEAAMDRSAEAVAALGTLAPAMKVLADTSGQVVERTVRSNEQLTDVLKFLPEHAQALKNVDEALTSVSSLATQLRRLDTSASKLEVQVQKQTDAIRRMDGTLWNIEQDELRRAMNRASDPPA